MTDEIELMPKMRLERLLRERYLRMTELETDLAKATTPQGRQVWMTRLNTVTSEYQALKAELARRECCVANHYPAW